LSLFKEIKRYKNPSWFCSVKTSSKI